MFESSLLYLYEKSLLTLHVSTWTAKFKAFATQLMYSPKQQCPINREGKLTTL